MITYTNWTPLNPITITYHMQGKITECWLAETEGIFP